MSTCNMESTVLHGGEVEVWCMYKDTRQSAQQVEVLLEMKMVKWGLQLRFNFLKKVKE